MSSPIHHAEDLDEALEYAPPWARRQALRDPEQPDPEQPMHAGPAPMQSPTRIGLGRVAFSGDLAMAKLQRQLSLRPDAVPEPPAFDHGESSWPTVLRFGGVAAVAAAIAWLVISLPNAWRPHDTMRTEVVGAAAQTPAADVQAPEVSPAVVKTETRDPLYTPEATDLLIQHGLAQVNTMQTMQQMTEATPATTAQPKPEPAVSEAPIAPAPSLDADEVAMLLKRGKELLGTGDFAGARLLLRRAAEAGSADAAMALATTFDPLVLRKLGAIGVAADPERARQWYGKAAALGSSAASQSLAQLDAAAQ
jgi:hypothetical protein